MSTIATATATAVPATTVWNLDPAHSNVEFSVRHLMIATVKGRFAGVSGRVRLDEADPSRSVIEVTIDAATIDTRVAQRDEHLRSADFFDVAQFPQLTFTSRQVSAKGGGEYVVVGDLTIRGATRQVQLAVTSHGEQIDPWGGRRAGFEASGKISRSEFGLTWNQALETGGVVVGDEVKISLDIELVAQA